MMNELDYSSIVFDFIISYYLKRFLKIYNHFALNQNLISK